MKLPTIRQYPKTIHINDEIYEIKFVKKLATKEVGECDPQTRVIKIKLGMGAPETFTTFIHEVLHAFEFEYDLNVDHPTIYKLEKAITDFLLTNF